jgi:hypothetical protein
MLETRLTGATFNIWERNDALFSLLPVAFQSSLEILGVARKELGVDTIFGMVWPNLDLDDIPSQQCAGVSSVRVF